MMIIRPTSSTYIHVYILLMMATTGCVVDQFAEEINDLSDPSSAMISSSGAEAGTEAGAEAETEAGTEAGVEAGTEAGAEELCEDPCSPDSICVEGRCQPVDEPCQCDDVFDPVCGEDGVEYGNECEARCAQAIVAYEGECREVSDEDSCFNSDEPPNCDVLCLTLITCIGEGCERPIYASFFDECMGQCSRQLDSLWSFLCDEPSSCEEQFDAFSNIVDDICEQENVDECIEPNPEANYVAFGDECELIDYGCGEGEDYYSDVCGCGCISYECRCPPGWDEPVCAVNGQRYANPCEAECQNQDDYFSCEMECECPLLYAPECGLDGQTYPNSCVRECAEVPLNYEGECGASGGLCSDIETEGAECASNICGLIADCHQEVCGEAPDDVLLDQCDFVCDEGLSELLCQFTSCQELISFAQPFLEFDLMCEVEELDCPEEGREATYVAYDSDTCSLIGDFNCVSGMSFNNFCGCGCLDRVCPDERNDNVRYVSYDTEVCDQITLNCPSGSQVFSDECGCGCTF